MGSPDRSWIVVGLGMVLTAIVAALLGAMVALWLVERPAPVIPARPVASAALPPKPAEPAPPVPAAAPTPAPPATAPTPAAPAPVAATPIPAPAPASPAPPEATSPAPAPPPTVPAAPAPAAAAPTVDADAVAATLPFTVQLGAFTEADRAQHLAKMLTDQGYPAQVETRKTSKGHEMHYVRLADGYDSMGEASSEAAALKRKLDIDAIPIRRQTPEAEP